MRWTEIGMAWRLMRYDAARQRKRVLLTVFAIAWGSTTLVLLLSFGEGITRQVTRGAESMGQGIGVVWDGVTTKPYMGLRPGRQIEIAGWDTEMLRARIPEIRSIAAEYERYDVTVTAGRIARTPRIQGVDPEWGAMRKYDPQPGGRFLDELDHSGRRRVAFLGNEIAEELFGKGVQPVGQQITIGRSPFTVVGVLQPKIQTDMYTGPDSKHVTIPSSTFISIFGSDGRHNLGELVYVPVRPELGDAAKAGLYRVLGSRYHFDPTDGPAIRIWDTRESQRITRNITVGVQIFLGIIGALTMLISGMGVANVMYALVKERTREIGLQMALGAKAHQVMLPFVFEASMMTAAGGALGTIVSLAIVKGVASLKFDAMAMQFVTHPTFSPGVAVVTAVVIGGIGLLAGFLPARRAAAVQPAVSLRYE